MWKSLFFLGNPGRKREKPLWNGCGGRWKEKRRPAVLHIPVEIRRWNVEKKWKREADGSFGFPPVLWNVESLSTGDVKSAVPDIF